MKPPGVSQRFVVDDNLTVATGIRRMTYEEATGR